MPEVDPAVLKLLLEHFDDPKLADIRHEAIRDLGLRKLEGALDGTLLLANFDWLADQLRHNANVQQLSMIDRLQDRILRRTIGELQLHQFLGALVGTISKVDFERLAAAWRPHADTQQLTMLARLRSRYH